MEAQLAEPEALARLVTLLPAGATAASAAAGAEGGLRGAWPCRRACVAGMAPAVVHCGLVQQQGAMGGCLPQRRRSGHRPFAGDGEQLQSLLAPLLRLLQRSPRLAVELAQVGWVQVPLPATTRCATQQQSAALQKHKVFPVDCLGMRIGCCHASLAIHPSTHCDSSIHAHLIPHRPPAEWAGPARRGTAAASQCHRRAEPAADAPGHVRASPAAQGGCAPPFGAVCWREVVVAEACWQAHKTYQRRTLARPCVCVQPVMPIGLHP